MNFNNLSDIALKMKQNKNFKVTLCVAAAAVAGVGAATVIICAVKSGEDKRDKKRVKTMTGTLKDTIHKKADSVRQSAAVTADEVCRVLDTVHGKLESAKKDIADGGLKVIRDISETIENVSEELKRNR